MSKLGTKKLIGIIAAGVALFAMAQNLGVVFGIIGNIFIVFTPIIIGGCIAFIINVPMSFFEKLFLNKLKFKNNKILNNLAKPLSLIISILILGAVLLVIIVIIIPEIASTVLNLSKNVPMYIDNTVKWIRDLYSKYPQVAERLSGMDIDWKGISTTALQWIKTSAEAILGSGFYIASSVVGGIISFFLSFVLSIYILFQKEKIAVHAKCGLRAIFSEKIVARILRVTQLTSNVFTKFLSGQCIEACILGSMVFVCMSIFNFPYALTISVLIAVFSFIPMFGVYIACTFGALLMLLQGQPIQAIMFFLMFVVIQQIEGNLIYPHVVGSSVGLSPIIVLIAIIVGGGLFGFVGMFISVPLSAVACALYKESIAKLLLRKKIKTQEKQQENKPENKPEKQPEK